MVVVIVNDRWLKVQHPGALSGKLSDFAGLIYFPLFIATLIEVAGWASRRPRWSVTPRLVAGVAMVTGTIFSLAKLTSWGATAYRTVFGVVWWPVDAMQSLFDGNGWPPLGRLGLTQDATDLIALPCLVIPVLIARQVSGTRVASENVTQA